MVGLIGLHCKQLSSPQHPGHSNWSRSRKKEQTTAKEDPVWSFRSAVDKDLSPECKTENESSKGL